VDHSELARQLASLRESMVAIDEATRRLAEGLPSPVQRLRRRTRNGHAEASHA
jgi:hypothetical protein